MTTVQMLISISEGGCVGLVEDVIVDREFRGRGIGTLLLEHIAEWGKSRNLKRLQLLADRERRRCGFLCKTWLEFNQLDLPAKDF
jgi:GNAT superfamily N-acetyltransferase